MALSLGVTIGSKIKVGKDTVEVLSILGSSNIQISVGQDNYHITDCSRTEIIPGVFVSCGKSDDRQGMNFSRLAFEAPRSIEIQRIGNGHA